jgi:hypothetical protein
MSINLNHLFILKTNIKDETGKWLLKKFLDSHPEIQQWNLDLNDIDCVLRVVSPTLCYETIIALVNKAGFDASELV